MSTPTPKGPLQQAAHNLIDELELKLKAALGALSTDLKGLLGKIHQQADEDATTVASQVGEDVGEAKQAAGDAEQAVQSPPAGA